MAQTVQDLVELGLSEAEAKRVINRKAKAEEKNAQAIALAEKRLPKAQADLDHASARQAHWAGVVEAAGTKVAKYTAIIAGEDEGTDVPEETEVEAEVPAEEPAKPARSRGKK